MNSLASAGPWKLLSDLTKPEGDRLKGKPILLFERNTATEVDLETGTLEYDEDEQAYYILNSAAEQIEMDERFSHYAEVNIEALPS